MDAGHLETVFFDRKDGLVGTVAKTGVARDMLCLGEAGEAVELRPTEVVFHLLRLTDQVEQTLLADVSAAVTVRAAITQLETHRGFALGVVDIIDLVFGGGRAKDMFGADLEALAASGAGLQEIGIVPAGGREDRVLAHGGGGAVGHGGMYLFFKAFALQQRVDRPVGRLFGIEDFNLRGVVPHIAVQGVFVMPLFHRLSLFE